MSIILDALNRSESDRQDERDVPGLHTVHGTAGSPPAPAWRRLLWPALALVFASLAAGGWWSGQRSAERTAPPAAVPIPAATVTEPPEQRRSAPPPPVPEAVPEQRIRVESARREDIAALYQSAAGARDTAPAPAVEPAARPAPAASPPGGSASSGVGDPELNIEALAKAAASELEELQTRDEPVVEHAAPFINELRQSQKDQIPSIYYRAHHWSGNPAERSVVLNKQTYREGQQVKPGLRLVEILEDSIVLDFQGTEFRLRSLNSWVNL